MRKGEMSLDYTRYFIILLKLPKSTTEIRRKNNITLCYYMCKLKYDIIIEKHSIGDNIYYRYSGVRTLAIFVLVIIINQIHDFAKTLFSKNNTV